MESFSANVSNDLWQAYGIKRNIASINVVRRAFPQMPNQTEMKLKHTIMFYR